MNSTSSIHAPAALFLKAFLLVLGSFCGAALKVPAATVSIQPIADTTLNQSYPNNNFGDGTTFTAGDRRYGGVTRSLMEFDIAGNVPSGATINSVSLTLHVVKTPDGGTASNFDLRRLINSWGEGTGSDMRGTSASANQATWNARFALGSSWNTPGGDFAPIVSASQRITGNGAYTFASTDTLVSDVQNWLRNPANNDGWILMSESENFGTTIRRFGSRDSGLNAPTLTIDFTPVPEPGTWGLLGLAAVCVTTAPVLRRWYSFCRPRQR